MTEYQASGISDDEIDAVSERIKNHLRRLSPDQLNELNRVLQADENGDVQGYLATTNTPTFIVQPHLIVLFWPRPGETTQP